MKIRCRKTLFLAPELESGTQGEVAGKDSRMGNDLIDIGRGDYRKTTPQERGL